MKPRKEDVWEMTAALMAVVGGIERARKQGGASSLAALQIVAVRGRVRPSDVAAELGVHQSTVTRQVQALEAGGYVAVVADPADRRSCFLSLTESGQGELERLTEVGLARFAAFVAEWDAEEVRTLARLLAKFEESKAAVNAQEQGRRPGGQWRRKS